MATHEEIKEAYQGLFNALDNMRKSVYQWVYPNYCDPKPKQDNPFADMFGNNPFSQFGNKFNK